MKKEKGVTLISLTVYIIVLTIVVGLIATISSIFYKNVKNISQTVDPIAEYTKFNSFFTEETENRDIRIVETDENKHYIILENADEKIQYTFIPGNKGIYRNKVKICRDIDECTFENQIQNGKNVIIVDFESGDYKKTITYTLNN